MVGQTEVSGMEMYTSTELGQHLQGWFVTEARDAHEMKHHQTCKQNISAQQFHS